jgi:hypothetical protein
MADTCPGDYPGVSCSDCGDEEMNQVYIMHWGPLVPAGVVGFFGPKCWAARVEERNSGLLPRPLGTKPRAEVTS